ncbi:MAG: hypothetical protein H6640_02890 [Caldilineaceae bacterium]|nr:hypothetical protein [Caldilineaceae bacterium]
MEPIAVDTLVVPFDLSALSPAERRQARQIADATIALVLKGLFHRVQPERYHITHRQGDLETRVAAAIGAIPAHRFARMQPKIEALRTDTVRLAETLGSFANLDIRSSGLDALIRQVAPHLVRSEAPSLASSCGKEMAWRAQLLQCVRALAAPDVDDQEMADASTQVLTAITDAAATFSGDWRVVVASLVPVLALVQGILFDDKDLHDCAH